MEELARQKVTDIHDLNAILRLSQILENWEENLKILYELKTAHPN